MVQDDLTGCASLKRIVCSGEALPADLARDTRQRLPNAGLFNLYGPTEAAIDVTHWTCVDEPGISVPIGRPINNLQIHILDSRLNPQPIGVPGELYIGGDGLARGYLASRADRGAFCGDPYGTGSGCIAPVTWRAGVRTGWWSSWAGPIRRSSCAACAWSLARSKRRCWITQRSSERWWRARMAAGTRLVGYVVAPGSVDQNTCAPR